ncbi:UNVERIFIED_CONTAM: Cationic amino acid transporter 2, vacuolar [Sesamum latifolium]|uniref:Cationic amino acid transporter 2, vacuolar n=1 Tax=Sesamum latifolium TaxID=2727402 RepID=A0AAW2VJ31_9LAMI
MAPFRDSVMQQRGGGFGNLVRRKQVDSKHANSSSSSRSGQHQLAKALTVPHLIAVGVGSTIGSGVYILVGTVAREHSGPALTVSFLIAGIAAALSAFCYAELASRFPSAGSAYHYSYIFIGEAVAWLIGWALMLEYTIGSSAVARGLSPNLALLFGGPNSLPSFIARQAIPGFGIVVDPCAAILVIVVTGLLCVGIKESTLIQGIVTSANICALIFISVAGGYLGFKTGWRGYELPSGYFPFGIEGMLAGASTVFFAYTGFDSVTSTAEESRILMAMARDGLLPSFFSDVSKSTQVPVKSTIVTGLIAGILAFIMDVEQLSGMVSLGTLLAYTMVAISVLILRYVPPHEVPLPPSFQKAIDSVSLRHTIECSSSDVFVENSEVYDTNPENSPLLVKKVALVGYSPSEKVVQKCNFLVNKGNQRKIAGWAITICWCAYPNFCYFNFQRPSNKMMQGTILGMQECCYLGRVSIWLGLALLAYVFYGRMHSPLQHAVYVPAAHVDEINTTSSNTLS